MAASWLEAEGYASHPVLLIILDELLLHSVERWRSQDCMVCMSPTEALHCRFVLTQGEIARAFHAESEPMEKAVVYLGADVNTAHWDKVLGLASARAEERLRCQVDAALCRRGRRPSPLLTPLSPATPPLATPATPLPSPLIIMLTPAPPPSIPASATPATPAPFVLSPTLSFVLTPASSASGELSGQSSSVSSEQAPASNDSDGGASNSYGLAGLSLFDELAQAAAACAAATAVPKLAQTAARPTRSVARRKSLTVPTSQKNLQAATGQQKKGKTKKAGATLQRAAMTRPLFTRRRALRLGSRHIHMTAATFAGRGRPARALRRPATDLSAARA